MRATVVGTASTYNPYLTGHDLGDNTQTASGEPYDPTAWTAAIQNDLREQFSEANPLLQELSGCHAPVELAKASNRQDQRRWAAQNGRVHQS